MKRAISILIMVMAFNFQGMSQIVQVHDFEGAMQDAFQFMEELNEMVNQGYNQAEQLMYKKNEFTERLQLVKEEVEDIAKLSKKVIVLYKEIDNCTKKLENIRKRIVASKYLSTDDKYAIYKKAQGVVYNIVSQRGEIEKIVQQCQTYRRNQNARDKEERLDDLISTIRRTGDILDDIERAARNIVEEKREIVESEYMLRSMLSIKLNNK